jgi:small-conductance mechanosensitive channel
LDENMPDQISQLWHYPLLKFADGAVLSPAQIAMAAIVFILGLFMARMVARVAARNLVRANVAVDAVNTVQKLVFILLTVVVFITSLRLLNIPITALTFLSGAVAIGIGFGAQNIINNFISGWILMSERPVRIGDFVEVENSKGVIEDIGNRCTRIRRVDGVHLLVPNSTMLERTVINWTLVDKDIRTTIRVGVAYGSPTHEVERCLRQAVNEHAHVKQTPEPLIIFEDFGDSALIFDVYFWAEVQGERELRQIRSDIRHRITELLQAAGITIAFPQRDVHLNTLAPLDIRLSSSEPAAGGSEQAP